MRLMIIGSLEGHITEAGKIAHRRGAQVAHAEDIEQALGALRAGKGADLVMIDVRQKIGEFIKCLENERIVIPVIACGVTNDAAAAVRAIKAGAKEYIPLPPDAELIAAVLEAVTEENNTMIASDPAMKNVLALADQIAPSDATVLITGESGTGKEVMARYIHQKSRRASKNFISVNCAAIPENLLESELFGHEKGAFTGAVARRIGKFEESSGGTLLLDEISEMHPSLQAKLLRAIQEKEITRIGNNTPVKVDIRLIATSNRDMEQAVRAGDFREDLYFRLNVINLRLPALRERPADIPALAQFFADKYSEHNGLPKKKISEAAAAKLAGHNWRGNIRELENTMHRAVLVSQAAQIEEAAIHTAGGQTSGAINQIAVSNDAAAPSASVDPQAQEIANLIGRTVADVERDLILNTLNHCLGNRTHAANVLGISIRTLRNKLKQYNDEGIAIPGSSTG